MTKLRAQIKRRTDKAILVAVASGREEWIPLSACDHISTSDTGSSVIEVEDWVVMKKALNELEID